MLVSLTLFCYWCLRAEDKRGMRDARMVCRKGMLPRDVGKGE